MNARYAILAASFSLGTALMAQNNFDIGLFPGASGTLEVKVRPADDFDGIFSSLVFSLRYDRNSDLQLGEPLQPADVAPYMAVTRSGGLRQEGSFDYQVYAGFGFQNMGAAGVNWQAGKEYTVLTIPCTGTGTVELINDAWTGEVRNNADYYVSLGGMDRTGIIYRSMVQLGGDDDAVIIQPNPNQGEFMFSFTSNEPVDIDVEMLNALGQTVYTERLRAFQGTFRKDMDLTSQSNGVYYLKVTRGGELSVHKVVYR